MPDYTRLADALRGKDYGTGEALVRDGKLGEHIGYGPEFQAAVDVKKSAEENLTWRGSGELGLILLDFQWNRYRSMTGYAELAKPSYELKLWPAENALNLEPPTIRSVVDMGLEIITGVVGTALEMAGNLFTGIGGTALKMALTTAINLSDDLLFGAMDLAGGYKSIEEVGLDFGKKALTTVASSAIGAAAQGGGTLTHAVGETGTKTMDIFVTQGLSGLIKEGAGSGISNVVGQAMLAGVQSITTSTVTSAVNAVTWDKEQGLGWSSDVFAAGVQSGITNMAVSMTSSFTTGMLGELNVGENVSKALGFTDVQVKDIQKFNATAGGLAGQGINYALGGDFTLNVLNLSMLDMHVGDKRIESGLFEVRFGRDGVSTAIGTGGVDMSYQAVAASLRED
jgi:hypothetical protein